jgi:hypothetical protein
LPDSPANQQQSQNLALDFIRFLELSLLCFRYRGRSYHIMQQAKRAKSKGVITFDPQHLIHHTNPLAQVANSPNWSENVRLQTLVALAVFVNLVSQ